MCDRCAGELSAGSGDGTCGFCDREGQYRIAGIGDPTAGIEPGDDPAERLVALTDGVLCDDHLAAFRT